MPCVPWCLEVDPEVAGCIRRGPRTGLPSILNVEVLWTAVLAARANAAQRLLDDSKPTPLEKAQGR